MSDTAYRATPERAGLALATGALSGGLVVAAAQFFGRQFDLATLSGGFVLGALASAAVIVLVGGPLWWWFQRREGRRGPVAAAGTGALVAFLPMLALQTQFFGLGLPAEDGRTLALRWLSAVAVGAVAALAGAGIALAMWLVGYRAIYLAPPR